MKLVIYPKDVQMIGHAVAETEFDDATDANSCLNKIRNLEFVSECDLSAFADRRNLSCRGVITD